MKVTLNDAEQKLAKYVAKQRYLNARSHGVVDGKVGEQSNDVTDLEGIAAEIAFCKMLNLYPDLEIENPASLPDWDCIMHNGKTVDIKSTVYESGRLLAVKGKENSKSEIYALVIGTFPAYRFAGMATKQELINTKNLTDFGRGEGYALKQSELNTTSINKQEK